jgi:hypothetical protein
MRRLAPAFRLFDRSATIAEPSDLPRRLCGDRAGMDGTAAPLIDLEPN